jgi:steroid delta-isomerase-like uncharacterized protein
MTDDVAANVARVRRYYDEVWNRGDLDVLPEVVGREVVGHDPGAGDFDFARLREFVRTFRAAFPDFETHAERLVAQGDTVALRFRSEGTFRHPFMDLPPTGRRFCNRGLVMYRFESGRIAEIWVEWDHRRFLQELGAGSDAAASR